MKLTKISLAALVALGAFSSVASATPLEEAIKDVDVSGFARYRYDYGSTKEGKVSDHMGSVGVSTYHKFKTKMNFKATFDDNFAGVLGIRYTSNDGTAGRGDTVNANNHFGVSQIYLDYTVGNTLVRVGKQELGAAYFVDDEIGTGILVLNSDIAGLTLGAFAIDALDADTEADGGLLEVVAGKNKDINDAFGTDVSYKPGNLYGVAALGSYDPIAFQLWYASLEKVVDLFAVDLSANVELNDDVSFGLQGQFVNSSADGKIQKTFGALAGAGTDGKTIYNNGKFYAFEATTGLFGADIAVGYLNWKTNKDAYTSLALEDHGKLINPGEQFGDFFDYTLINGKGSFYYANAGYTFDKFFVGADYVAGKVKIGKEKEKYKEGVARFGYNYSKKLKFTTFYSAAEKKAGDNKEKSNLYRFEAKYSF